MSVLVSWQLKHPRSWGTILSGLASPHWAPRQSLLEALWSLLAQPWEVEGKGADVGLKRLSCLKVQPVEESRNQHAWIQGRLGGPEGGLGLCEQPLPAVSRQAAPVCGF